VNGSAPAFHRTMLRPTPVFHNALQPPLRIVGMTKTTATTYTKVPMRTTMPVTESNITVSVSFRALPISCISTYLTSRQERVHSLKPAP